MGHFSFLQFIFDPVHAYAMLNSLVCIFAAFQAVRMKIWKEKYFTRWEMGGTKVGLFISKVIGL